MKKLILALCLYTSYAQAQEPCLSEILFQEQAKKDPSSLEARQNLEIFTQNWIAQHGGEAKYGAKSATATYIIPVVFHVIHKGGAENISDANILAQLNVINQDFSRQNPDAVNTYAPFVAAAANTDIEFRLAQIDPNGNCTTGINRIYSPLTTNARSNIKALIDWPRDKYLNIWTVESIENTNQIAGVVLGFATFPGPDAALDGAVVRASSVGPVSSAGGRVSTHELGHWLNLRHIWGDEAACANDDGVGDTPLQGTYTFSTCPSSPYFDACQPNGDGIMFQNYMDYTAYTCMNLFTQGQAARMDAALNSATGQRSSIWQQANLIATGTDGTPAVLCTPIADFIPRTRFVCEGGSLTFKEMSWGGADTARSWSFPSGSPSTDTSAQPTVMYATPGSYDVSLTASNSAGSDTKTVTNHVIVSPNVVAQSVPYAEGFENGTFPFNDWYVINDNGSSSWETTSIAAASGINSLVIDNMAGPAKGPDEFITPAFNFSNVSAGTMTFKVAFAYKSASTNTDRLQITYSTDCGETWTLRKTLSGVTFPTTASYFSSAYFPAPSDWRTESVPISTVAIMGKPNVRFRFEFMNDNGNNIYIDDININGTVGIGELLAEKANLNIYPNPSKTHTYVSFTTDQDFKVRIEISDVTGRIVNTISENMNAGDHQVQLNNNLEKGVYFVRLFLDNNTITKRVVMQ